MSFDTKYFGKSHSPEIGVISRNFPKGEEINLLELQEFLDRRRPGTSSTASQRNEADIPLFKSGVDTTPDLNVVVTNGEELKAIIKNNDISPNDYNSLKDTPRPGHADYTAFKKYGDSYDETGGGQFSGRLTAPMCILGGICLQILKRRGITISATVKKTGNIEKAKESGDSVGGIVSCQIDGVPAGIGGPFGDGLESKLASALFSIPAVKGVEFGAGFSAADMLGSQCNDAFIIKDNQIITETNNCGGILGGISNGMPITFNIAFKPTPSISKEQKTVNIKTLEETTISIVGRHDTCIVPRALPVVEAVAATCITEVLLEENKL
ncbi:MAG: chorismate synthase [Oscillospiraceae bacterium]|nr:chorismate synthase [Candidatus Limimonas coprohippi]MCQ2487677.1 chorismate synthase [Clostridia bacterium]